ncbi:MAG: o-succinylbenzoate synthase [Gemmatimonadaceae bacterium]|nr:o-succinylbenzoate synthase [Gemmatimonadaceae bacterium]NUO93662.1 o-succinylbenzoate synthase [Gemmatimonadaceae bacterium]NUP55285.1 o-succinylbenzoate synthase [Gemmatimonadaceae bacterium]NUP69905.1 o-succinylbenzoate synthase [Gemmatimonadaceae bacterium]NUR33058.1 o-succinylbenzoate synthase [Gemmatimonadaceae bacterium]
MLRIDRIALREIRLALKEPFRISSGIVHDRRIALLELTDRDGASVFSECVAFQLPNYSSETIDTAWHALREWLVPRVLGRELTDPAVVHALLDENIKGHNMAKAALEMGCWGLAAEAAQVPLSRLLGGTRDRVPTGISIGIQSEPAALAARAQAAVAAGYRKIKVKIRPGQDVDYVRAVRTALGGGIGVMADANSAYTLADSEQLGRLDAFDLIMLEQPLGDDDLVRHATLQRRMTTPICLDESITSVDRAEDMIALRSGRIVNIKPGRVGGFSASKAIHDVCESAGIPVWCGGMLESGIGRAYNVALASLPNFSLPGDLSPSARYWHRDVVTPEWTMDDDGMVHVPTRPGLGITVDREFLDSLTVRTEELSARPTMVAVG